MSSQGFRRIALPAVTVVAGLTFSLVGAGTASATGEDCGTKFCIKVDGGGLHVDSALVSTKSGDNTTGYFFVQIINGSSSTWDWSTKGPAHSAFYIFDTDYKNNTLFCGGVAPTKEEKDYAGIGCITVHK